ncbi:5'-methylthioadenosine/S-adenosylhomocysteine nucleosidase family protein [Desulfotalea psychrophila]|uniref:Related to 5'-methylthioadenosine/S-adenosylhomocysteine nuclosidase n=1 Tax=Desulfotalea psychrophila (strain LSv54 / DSM 12343) TaxID=177439 RepID=Q6AMZ9_DESPS|nr:5'-methylthioadenosine/S-adenosylhomocysteine nucleosidase [Desulfotalea psychrophila]CAG36275.1 related to 5'-methylthioadenosine/S-adenosylhomocysteine nuclosidase [Desulfotalea psychrophila LSv54]
MNIEKSHFRTIGVLSAMPAELEHLEANIIDKQEVAPGIAKGRIGSHTVYATLSGIGKVNAAATVQRLISEFKIDIIMFSGVAGAINPEYRVGDVVLLSRAFQHDFGHLGRAFKMHAVGVLPEIGIGSGEESPYLDLNLFWQEDVLVNLKKRSVEFSKSFSPVQVNGQDYLPALKIDGTVATGDQFIASDAKKKVLQSQGADIAEMEGAAVAQVAAQNKIPCMIFRSVSDTAGGEANLDFQNFFATVAKNNAELAAYLIGELP